MIKVAIVGMAALFPASPDVATYWQNILNGVTGIGEPPAQAWDMSAVFDPDSDAPNRIYQKRGGFLGQLATFNPVKNGVTPNAIDGTEPDQWIALELARKALLDAGYPEDQPIPEREKAAVILGRGAYINRGNSAHFQNGSLVDETIAIITKLNPQLSADSLTLLRHSLTKQLPPFNPTVAQGLIPNIIAGRIANKLDLMGPAYTLDAACASSLVAVEHAVRGLHSGDLDLAIVGGSYMVSPAPMTMIFSQLRALSRRGEVRPFDETSDGTLLGEGMGLLVLKRLEDALRDGQRVYAVIRGVATANDGRGKSVIAPRLDGVITAMRRTYAQAPDLLPQTIGLIEAHGLGTPLGDTTELQALQAIFGERSADDQPTIALGSVKGMIGHLMPASGAAGLIKTALALHHRLLPPTHAPVTPRQAIDWRRSRFYLNPTPREWVQKAATPRRAAVNSFGFGGVSAHLILEEAPPHRVTRPPLAWQETPTDRVVVSLNRPTLLLEDSVAQTILTQQPAVPATSIASPTIQGDLSMNHQPLSNATNPLAGQLLASYTQLMTQFLQVQRDVMIAALGGQGGGSVPSAEPLHFASFAPPPVFAPPPAPPAPVVAPEATNGYHPPVPNGYSNGMIAKAEPSSVIVAPAPVVAPAPTVPAPAQANIAHVRQTLLEIVAERTGYPAEMIGLDLDLEADLGIDSIKRVEILGAFQKKFGELVSADDMDSLTERKTINQIVAFIEGRTANFNQGGADAPSSTFLFPFIRANQTQLTANRLEARCVLNSETELLLRDHTLGRDFSLGNATLSGLPVLPMMGSAELLAEAAQTLHPDQSLCGVRDLRAFRWVVVERGTLDVTVVAEQRADGTVHCAMRAGEEMLAEGIFLFGPFAPSPMPQSAELQDPQPSKWARDRLYSDSSMFHGPRLQGVRSLDSVGANGLQATVEVLGDAGLFLDLPNAPLVLDPVFLDQVAQLVGFWGLQRLPNNTTILPTHLEQIELFAPTPSAGTQVSCEARITTNGPRTSADVEVVLPDGTLWMRLRGLGGHQFSQPPRWSEFAFSPNKNRWLSLPNKTPQGLSDVILRRATEEMYPLSFFGAFGGVWMKALAFAVLGPQERVLWQSLSYLPRRKLEWLLVRMAAKDGLRQLLQEQGVTLLPADIEILPDAQGKPHVVWSQAGPPPSISLSHSGGVALAAVQRNGLVGVDIEVNRTFPADAWEMAFSAEERLLLGSADLSRWRGWCAKECVNKALGLPLSPRQMTILDVTPNTLIVKKQEQTLTIYTEQQDDLVIALVCRELAPNEEKQ